MTRAARAGTPAASASSSGRVCAIDGEEVSIAGRGNGLISSACSPR